MTIDSSVQDIQGQYSFYIKAVTEHATEAWAELSNSTQQHVIEVSCGSVYTSITEGAYLGTAHSFTLNTTQFVQSNNADASLLTRFMLPVFTSNETNCPISSMTTLNNVGMADPVLVSTD